MGVAVGAWLVRDAAYDAVFGDGSVAWAQVPAGIVCLVIGVLPSRGCGRPTGDDRRTRGRPGLGAGAPGGIG
jgi:hypothetical protein